MTFTYPTTSPCPPRPSPRPSRSWLQGRFVNRPPAIADLEKQLVSHTIAPKIIERVEVPLIGDEQLRSLEATVAALAEVDSQRVTIAQDLGATLARVSAPTPIAQSRPAATVGQDQAAPAHTAIPTRPAPVPPLLPRPTAHRRRASTTLGASVPPQPQASEELRSMGQEVLCGGEGKMLEELGRHANYTASSGTFRVT
jgi:hypothetical protein